MKLDGVPKHTPFSLDTNKLEGLTFAKLDKIFVVTAFGLGSRSVCKGPKSRPHSLLSPSGGFILRLCIICVPSKGHRFFHMAVELPSTSQVCSGFR